MPQTPVEPPNCNDLVSQPSETAGWLQWGIQEGDQFIPKYGLQEGLSNELAGYYLDFAGICELGPKSASQPSQTLPDVSLVIAQQDPPEPAAEVATSTPNVNLQNVIALAVVGAVAIAVWLYRRNKKEPVYKRRIDVVPPPSEGQEIND